VGGPRHRPAALGVHPPLALGERRRNPGPGGHRPGARHRPMGPAGPGRLRRMGSRRVAGGRRARPPPDGFRDAGLRGPRLGRPLRCSRSPRLADRRSPRRRPARLARPVGRLLGRRGPPSRAVGVPVATGALRQLRGSGARATALAALGHRSGGARRHEPPAFVGGRPGVGGARAGDHRTRFSRRRPMAVGGGDRRRHRVLGGGRALRWDPGARRQRRRNGAAGRRRGAGGVASPQRDEVSRRAPGRGARQRCARRLAGGRSWPDARGWGRSRARRRHQRPPPP
jgi:hypothetical protein